MSIWTDSRFRPDDKEPKSTLEIENENLKKENEELKKEISELKKKRKRKQK